VEQGSETLRRRNSLPRRYRQNDHIVSSSYEGQKYIGPDKVMDDFRNLLAQGGTSVAAVTMPASSAAPLRNATPPSPSGTNWDEVFKKKP
jgi:hypothetical protein